jgi:uncharacterized protein (DUF2237 family)
MNNNIFGEPLKICGKNPLTGYNRTGFCTLSKQDRGTHIVCAIVDDKFLNFTFSKGNDLITSSNNFQGLKAGDRWCLCVLRWLEAYNNGVAPLLDLDATSQNVLKYANINLFKQYDYKKRIGV